MPMVVRDSEKLPIHTEKPPLPRKPVPFIRLCLVVASFCAAYILFHCHTSSDVVQIIPKATGTSNPAYLIKAKHGAAATENLRCSTIGVETLKLGGNAVDAAVASTFCIGVVNMFSSGIGGGGFMTVRIPGAPSQVITIDFRETSPAISNSTMYVNNPTSARWGGLAVGIPGEVKGLFEAHSRWGKLPWASVVRPSAELASGWKVDPELSRRIGWFAELMLKSPDWSSIFAPEGRLLHEGEIIRRTNLSRTLYTIAEDGPDAFYKGPIADAMIDKVQKTGGILTHEDLLNYTVIVSPALSSTYRGRKLYTLGAPSSGPALFHMFNLIERYKFDTRDGLEVHRLVEALKFGFAARTSIGDLPWLNDTSKVLRIPTKSYADEIAKNLTDDATHPPEYYNPEYDAKMDHGTSHLSVIDESGMAVSLTSTVNLIFGSAVMDPITGIILNDEQDDFSTPGFPNGFGLWPSPYNYPEPGKRPLSSMTPLIIENEDGSLYASIGGAGGGRIFGAVFQTILNLIEWGMDASEAVEYGRVHDQLYPLEMDADDTLPIEVINGLLERGHNVTVADINRVAAVVNVVVRETDGTIYAASDSRKNGIAAGY